MQNKTKGFTIIEVVLVLAIAGLIFLMIFLALPALQRNQRDTQRRSDAGRVQAALQNYQSNNNGRVPADQTAITAFTTSYLRINGDGFADPSGTDYTLTYKAAAADGTLAVPANQMFVHVGAVCDGENATATGANARNVAVRVDLEGAGSYCVHNR